MSGLAVTVGALHGTHAAAGRRVVQQPVDLVQDMLSVRAYQQSCAGRDGFRAFRAGSCDKHRLAQGRGFFLYTARVGQHQRAVHEQIDKGRVIQRLQQKDVGKVRQQPPYRLLHMGIAVYRVHDLHVITTRYGRDGLAAGLAAVTEIFPAVPGDQHQSFVSIQERKALFHLRTQRIILAQALFHGQKRIDHRIARHMDALRPDAFIQQVVARLWRRGKMHIRQRSCEATVHFLRPGGVLVPCTQPRFHMAYGQACVVGGQSRAQGSGGIPVHQHHIRPPAGKDAGHAVQYVFRQRLKALVRPHQIKVKIRPDGEHIQYLIQHLSVLGGDADFGVKIGIVGKRVDHGSHFDGFGTGTEYAQDLHCLFSQIVGSRYLLADAPMTTRIT